MLDWIGLQHVAQPKPPRSSKAFRYFRRGLLVGLLVGGAVAAGVVLIIMQTAPYCGW